MPNQAEINVDPKVPIIRACKPLVRPRLVLNYCDYNMYKFIIDMLEAYKQTTNNIVALKTFLNTRTTSSTWALYLR